MEWKMRKKRRKRVPTERTTKHSKEQEQDGEMSLSGHLRELRNRILACVIVLVVAILAGLHYAPQIVQVFLQMGEGLDYEFVYIAPQELMLQYFYVSFLFGICVTIPVLLYQAWAFIRPGLKKSENFLFLIAMIFGLLCFGAGACFAYKIMLPFMLYFFNTLSIGSGVSAYISVQNYLSFLLMVLIIFGIVFELPMVSVVLNRLGLLKASWMKAGRRVVIVVIFVIEALITPPDIVSQITVAVPVILLYELSIFLCSVCEKIGHRKEDPEENENERE